MDRIKFIDEELRVLRDHDSEDEELCVSLRPIGGVWASSDIIGFQLLNHSGQCLLCMNNVVYVLEKDRIIRELTLERVGFNCHAYIYIKNYPKSGKRLSAHAFFLDDGTIEIYGINKARFYLLRKIQVSETVFFRKGKSECLTACVETSICFSYDRHTIFRLDLNILQHEAQFEAINEIYRTNSGELIFFGFLKNSKQLLSVYKNVSNGVEYAEYSHSNESNYFVTSRVKLGSENGKILIWNQLTSDWIIGLGIREVWSFKASFPPIKFKNNGLVGELLPNLDSKVVDSTRVSLEVYSKAGRIFTAVISASKISGIELIWSERGSLLSSLHMLDDLEFAAPLYHQAYLVASNSTGISYHNIKKDIKHQIKNCPYQRATYLDGNLLPTASPMVNSYLLCGAYNDEHGFLQKRTIRCNFESIKTIQSKPLLHSPVSEIWLTEGDLVYESMEKLYSVSSDDEIAEFQGGIWCNKDGVVIRDEIGDIVSIAPLLKVGTYPHDALVLIRKNGTIEITEYMECQNRVLFECKMKEKIGNTAVVAAYFDGQFHIAVSFQFNRLNVLCGNDLVYSTEFTEGFIVSDITLKRIAKKFYYIATSMDGRCLVYTLDSPKPLMQIEGSCKTKSHLFDFGQESKFVLVYNRSESIVIDLASEIYKNVGFDVEPYRIIPHKRNGNDIYSFYILGYDWTLHLVEWNLNSSLRADLFESTVEVNNFEMGKSIPMQVLPLDSNLSVVALKCLPKAKIILFDFLTMDVLASYTLGENCSNVIVRPLWNDTAKLDSFESYMLQRLVLVSFVSGKKPCFQILRIEGYEFVLQQKQPLLQPALTVVVDHEKMQVSFEGLQSQVYGISFVSGRRGVYLKQLLASLGSLERFQSNIHEIPILASRLNRIRLVSTKQIAENLILKKKKAVGYLTSFEIMEKFLTAGSHYKKFREYTAMVDYENYINLAHISHRLPGGGKLKSKLSSFCRFRLNSRILSISPAPCVRNGAQVMDVGCRSKVIYNVPLFIITCANGSVLMLNEIVGRKVMRSNKLSVDCSLSSYWKFDGEINIECSMGITDGTRQLNSSQSGT